MPHLVQKLIALTISILVLPLMVWVGLWLFLKLGRNIFFVQQRVGKGGRLFFLYKFKTMQTTFDAEGNLLPDKERLTPWGRWLRKTSLDELPQLWNVIKGDMNLVGPRPLLPEYLPLYNLQQQKRHLVKPGITGWAQVKGRNALSWQERFALDVWYVAHRSWHLDLKILWLTFLKIFKKQDGDVLSEPFKGNE